MFQKILRSLVLLLPLSFGSWAAADTVTLQDGLNGYAGTADNWIVANSGANINRGADVNVAIRAVSDYGIYRFPIFAAEGGPVPNNATIQSATLSLYKAYGPDAVMRAQRLTKTWTEMGSTWNSTGTVNWTTPGGDVIATPDGTGSVPDSEANNCADGIGHEICWLNIDVTAGVQAFAATPGSNFGWRVSAVSSSEEFTPKNFNSRNNTNFPQYRPKLTVTYTTGPVACNSGTLRPYDGAPVNGTPIAIAAGGATWEAEHFNCGGQDVAYHDNVAGNNGAAFRATEDVDIIASTDSAGGGYVIQNFYTGEWLTYTVNVTQAGTYDFAIRASADNPGSFHLEVDGVNVTGNVPVPNTGSLNSYVWVTKTGINLAAGQHVLKLVSDQQFFWVNQLRFTPSGCTLPTASLNATPSSGAAPLNVTFDASASTDGSSPITSLTLDFGDGSAPVTWANKATTQPHTYSASATASLTATSACGTSSPATQPISVIGDDNVPASPVAGALGTALPTFHSMSLYYNPQATPTNETVWMRYRRASETTWRQGWHLWFDPRTTGNALPYAYRARGSAVYLEPNTKYYFEFGTGTSHATATWHHHVAGTTWSETFAQDGATTVIPAGSTAYNITVGGSAATGYKVYDAQNNLRALNGAANQNWCVRVTVPYVIVRNLRCTGALQYGVAIAANVTNVVVEDSDISDWAWFNNGTKPGWPWPFGANEIGGIQLQGNNSRIVLQRNKIHDPHYGAHPWDFGHPIGPTAIMAIQANQQNVMRYNEVYATNGDTLKQRWLLDGIMGTDNFGTAGFPGADSDIYHNIIKHVMDDGIEAEGGGRNVRVWGNYMDHVAVGMGTTTAHFGPIYVFRNVFNRMRFYHHTTHPEPDDDNWDRGPMFKSYGVNGGYGGGRHYYFHNTALQQPGSTYTPAQSWDLGAGFGLYGASGGNQGIRQVWTRNNVLHTFRSNSQAINVGAGGGANSFDFDLYNGSLVNESGTSFTEPNGISGVPTYKPGHGWSAGPRLTSEGGTVGEGNFQLNTTSLGLNNGTPLPNFAADIDNVGLARKSGVEVNGNPDRGAHDSASTQPMKFGLPAAQ